MEPVGGTQERGCGVGHGRRPDRAQESEIGPAEQHVELKPNEQIRESSTPLLDPLG